MTQWNLSVSYTHLVLKLLADTNMTQSKKEDLIVALFAYVQGLTTVSYTHLSSIYCAASSLKEARIFRISSCSCTYNSFKSLFSFTIAIGSINNVEDVYKRQGQGLSLFYLCRGKGLICKNAPIF